MNTKMWNSKSRSASIKLFEVFILLVVLTSTTACSAMQLSLPFPQSAPAILDGAVYAVQPGSTLYGLSQAITMQPGTALYINPTNRIIIATWPVEGMGQAWAQLENVEGGFASFMRAAGGKGSLVNSNTWAGMYKHIVDGGWQKILPSAMSAGLMKEIGVAALATTTTVAAGTMPSVLFVVTPPIDINDIFKSLFPSVGS